MVHSRDSNGTMIWSFMAVAMLLGCPQFCTAAGTWSVISLPQGPGDVVFPAAVALDAAENLYVADQSNGGRIQKRDAAGNWSVIAARSTELGTVSALAADAEGSLYVLDSDNWRIQKRDAMGNWSTLAPVGDALGQVDAPTSLAMDAAGNLYVADLPEPGQIGRIQKRDAQGHWSIVAQGGYAPGQVDHPTALAVDQGGNLFVAESLSGGFGDTARVRKLDRQGHWSAIALTGPDYNPIALAVDQAGNLYLAGRRALDIPGYVWRQDAQGNGAILAQEFGSDPGPRVSPTGLALDGSGNLYVADPSNNRVLEYVPGP